MSCLKNLGSEILEHLLIIRQDFKMNRFRVQVKHGVVTATTVVILFFFVFSDFFMKILVV